MRHQNTDQATCSRKTEKTNALSSSKEIFRTLSTIDLAPYQNVQHAQEDISTEPETIPDVIQNQAEFWSSLADQKEFIKSSIFSETNLEIFMLEDATCILNRMAAKRDRLLGYFTSNLTENLII